jgi:hypothetical protein
VEATFGSTRFHQTRDNVSAFEEARRERERALARNQRDADVTRSRRNVAQDRGEKASIYIRDKRRGEEVEKTLNEALLRDRRQKLEQARRKVIADENRMLLHGRQQAASQRQLENGIHCGITFYQSALLM